MQSDPRFAHAEISEVKTVDTAEDEETAERLGSWVGVPTDGRLVIRYPKVLPEEAEGEPETFILAIPFRDHRKDDAPWFGSPDATKWGRDPVWKWENPEEPPENITLSPSYGQKRGEEWYVHLWVRDGGLEVL